MKTISLKKYFDSHINTRRDVALLSQKFPDKTELVLDFKDIESCSRSAMDEIYLEFVRHGTETLNMIEMLQHLLDSVKRTQNAHFDMLKIPTYRVKDISSMSQLLAVLLD